MIHRARSYKLSSPGSKKKRGAQARIPAKCPDCWGRARAKSFNSGTVRRHTGRREFSHENLRANVSGLVNSAKCFSRGRNTARLKFCSECARVSEERLPRKSLRICSKIRTKREPAPLALTVLFWRLHRIDEVDVDRFLAHVGGHVRSHLPIQIRGKQFQRLR